MSTSSTKQPRLPPPPSSGGAIYNTRNSKKRAVSSLNSDFLMDPEVIEIPPPTPRSFKSKQKQVVTHEVIDVDKDEDSADILIVDVRVNARDKGKAVKSSSGHSSIIRTEDIGAKSPVLIDSDEPSNNAAPELHNMDLSYDDELYDSYIGDFMDVDDYSLLQAHFDSVDIPAGVEASIPWFPDLSANKKKAFHENISLTDGSDQSLLRWLAEPAHINKNAASVSSSKMPLTHSLGGASLSSPSLYPQESQSTKKSSTSQHKVNSQYLPFELSFQSALVGCSTNSSSGSQSDAMTLNHPVTPAIWDNFPPPVPKKFGPGSSFYSNLPVPVDALNSVVDPSMSWWPPSMNPKYNFNKNVYSSFADSVDGANITPQEVANIRNQITVNEEDILSKLQHFKQFDTVEDVSDHHYASKSSKQPPKNWAKKIQEEWRILEKDLPDTIFVRVYESRMDLLRAVIIGAEGTPYHDGLFFFDVFFPASYPKVPPHVFYHSGGLRLNPNLYSCGKVCLSLLNTWSGSKNEKWIPGTSTMLQVLVSIQALILNQKPYFNEPGWEKQNGTARGELMSRQYNEDTFILSLKTMTYSMRRPPKHFGDFVVGHFYKRAHDILVACKAYMDGAQVGCLVKGGVQDVDEGDKSCSQNFKNSLAGCVNMLVKEFTALGAKDCEKFLTAPKCRINRADNSSKSAI